MSEEKIVKFPGEDEKSELLLVRDLAIEDILNILLRGEKEDILSLIKNKLDISLQEIEKEADKNIDEVSKKNEWVKENFQNYIEDSLSLLLESTLQYISKTLSSSSDKTNIGSILIDYLQNIRSDNNTKNRIVSEIFNEIDDTLYSIIKKSFADDKNKEKINFGLNKLFEILIQKLSSILTCSDLPEETCTIDPNINIGGLMIDYFKNIKEQDEKEFNRVITEIFLKNLTHEGQAQAVIAEDTVYKGASIMSKEKARQAFNQVIKTANEKSDASSEALDTKIRKNAIKTEKLGNQIKKIDRQERGLNTTTVTFLDSLSCSIRTFVCYKITNDGFECPLHIGKEPPFIETNINGTLTKKYSSDGALINSILERLDERNVYDNSIDEEEDINIEDIMTGNTGYCFCRYCGIYRIFICSNDPISICLRDALDETILGELDDIEDNLKQLAMKYLNFPKVKTAIFTYGCEPKESIRNGIKVTSDRCDKINRKTQQFLENNLSDLEELSCKEVDNSNSLYNFFSNIYSSFKNIISLNLTKKLLFLLLIWIKIKEKFKRKKEIELQIKSIGFSDQSIWYALTNKYCAKNEKLQNDKAFVLLESNKKFNDDAKKHLLSSAKEIWNKIEESAYSLNNEEIRELISIFVQKNAPPLIKKKNIGLILPTFMRVLFNGLLFATIIISFSIALISYFSVSNINQTQYELRVSNDSIKLTQNDLSITQRKLKTTQEKLLTTQTNLLNAQEQLKFTQENLQKAFFDIEYLKIIEIQKLISNDFLYHNDKHNPLTDLKPESDFKRLNRAILTFIDLKINSEKKLKLKITSYSPDEEDRNSRLVHIKNFLHEKGVKDHWFMTEHKISEVNKYYYGVRIEIVGLLEKED